MLGLQYLKYLNDESNEQIVIKFVENPYYQYFCGNQHFEHRLSIYPSSMTRFHKRIEKDREIIEMVKRRRTLEPIFGHLKNGNGLDRNKLKGRDGDHINAVVSVCVFN